MFLDPTRWLIAKIFLCLSILLSCAALTAWAAPPAAGDDTGRFAPVQMVEDHSQALVAAARAGLKNATILHIDGHDDLWPPISDEKIAQARRLIRERDFSGLEKSGLFFTPADEALYGINNFLILAHRLGIIKNVYWALPTLETPDRETLEGLKKFLTNRGKPFGTTEGTELTVDPPFLKGMISSVPVIIGGLAGFERDDAPLWLDIDLDYFPELYSNPVKDSYVSLLAGFTDHLVKKDLRAKLTTISYSQNGGYLPISARFIGSWLKQLLEDPTLLQRQPPESWVSKEEAWYQEYFYQFQEAVPIYDQLLQQTPDNADLHYSRGMNLFNSGNDEQALAALIRAAKLDPAYEVGFLNAASFLANRKDFKTQEKVLEKAQSLFPENPLILDALGSFHHNRGDYPEAAEYYRRVIDLKAASAVTYTYLGNSLLLAGQAKEAIAAYRQAIDFARKNPDSEPMPLAWLQLGKALEETGETNEALSVYRDYLALFDWASESQLTKLAQNRIAVLAPGKSSD